VRGVTNENESFASMFFVPFSFVNFLLLSAHLHFGFRVVRGSTFLMAECGKQICDNFVLLWLSAGFVVEGLSLPESFDHIFLLHCIYSIERKLDFQVHM
jgi:hypothetical protein